MKSFNKRAWDLEEKARNYINNILPKGDKYIILFDADNEENEKEFDISDMPDFPYYTDKAGFFDFANVVGIKRNEKDIIVKAITKEYCKIVEVNLNQIELYGICSLADLLTSKFKN